MGPAQKDPSLPFTSHTAALPLAALEARNPQNLQAVLPPKQWCQPLGCLRAVLSDQAIQAPAMRQAGSPCHHHLLLLFLPPSSSYPVSASSLVGPESI